MMKKCKLDKNVSLVSFIISLVGAGVSLASIIGLFLVGVMFGGQLGLDGIVTNGLYTHQLVFSGNFPIITIGFLLIVLGAILMSLTYFHKGYALAGGIVELLGGVIFFLSQIVISQTINQNLADGTWTYEGAGQIAVDFGPYLMGALAAVGAILGIVAFALSFKKKGEPVNNFLKYSTVLGTTTLLCGSLVGGLYVALSGIIAGNASGVYDSVRDEMFGKDHAIQSSKNLEITEKYINNVLAAQEVTIANSYVEGIETAEFYVVKTDKGYAGTITLGVIMSGAKGSGLVFGVQFIEGDEDAMGLNAYKNGTFNIPENGYDPKNSSSIRDIFSGSSCHATDGVALLSLQLCQNFYNGDSSQELTPEEETMLKFFGEGVTKTGTSEIPETYAANILAADKLSLTTALVDGSKTGHLLKVKTGKGYSGTITFYVGVTGNKGSSKVVGVSFIEGDEDGMGLSAYKFGKFNIPEGGFDPNAEGAKIRDIFTGGSCLATDAAVLAVLQTAVNYVNEIL